MQEATHPNEMTYRAHFIWMSDSQGDPTVRILLVATGGIKAVYEGLGPWSYYSNWIRNLLNIEETNCEISPEKSRKPFKRLPTRNRFTTFQGLRIPACELALHDFHRVDR